MRIKPDRLLAGVACTLLFVGPLTARAGVPRVDDTKADDAKAVSMAPSLKVGDTVQYKNTVKLDFSGQDITVEQKRKHTVKAIKENKDIVVLVEDTGSKVSINGGDMETPTASPLTLTLNKTNQIVTFKLEREENPYFTPSTQHLIALGERILFPDKPVKPGDSWTTEIANPQVKDKKVKVKTTFVGEDKADGVPAWKVKQTFEADTESADSKLTIETTALLDAANGQIIESEQNVKGIPTQMGSIAWKGKLKRIKPDAAKAEK